MKTPLIFLCIIISCELADAAPQAKSNPNKPARVYVKKYELKYDFSVSDYTILGMTPVLQHSSWIWSENTSTTFSDYNNILMNSAVPLNLINDSHTVWPADIWPPTLPGTRTLTTTWIGNSIPPSTNIQSAVPPTIPWTSYNIQSTGSFWNSSDMKYLSAAYNSSAKTELRYFTGGKKIPRRFNLHLAQATVAPKTITWGLGVGAGGGPWSYWSNSVAYSNGVVAGIFGTMGNDGRSYKALPDGGDFGITPQVGSITNYNMTVTAQKYWLNITANGNPLAADHVRAGAYFCVGQKVNFQAIFSPDISSSLNYNGPIWNYTADYINHHWIDVNGCEEYNVAGGSAASNPATFNPTVAWFCNKQTQDSTANLGMYCKFNNGQSVYLVRQGKFNVFTPSITFFPSGGFTVNVRHYNAAVLFGVGQDNGTGALGISANINSIPKFPGQAIATQLVNRQASIDGIPFGTGGTNELDNYEIYPRSQSSMTNDPANPHSNLLGTVTVSDQPGIPITVYTLLASGNDHFNTYFRFKPDGDADNIYVTLGRADWDWHGNVDYTGGTPYDPWTLSNWTISGVGVGGPTFTQTNNFPVWPAVYSNFGF